MNAVAATTSARSTGGGRALEITGAWLFALLWAAPLLYALWSAFHPPAYATQFDATAPLTLENFARAWATAPFARYLLNTFILVTMVLAGQFVVCTLPPLPSRASPSPAARSHSSSF